MSGGLRLVVCWLPPCFFVVFLVVACSFAVEFAPFELCPTKYHFGLSVILLKLVFSCLSPMEQYAASSNALMCVC